MLEEYPSPVEGIGLENREVAQAAQGFESLFLRHIYIYLHRGVEQMVARWAHNPEVGGSSPVSPTIFNAEIAQLVEQLTCNQ